MEQPDTIHLSFLQNPHMREACKNSKTGETVEFEKLITQFKSMSADGVDLTVQNAVPKGYSIDALSDKLPDPVPVSAVSVVLNKHKQTS